MNVIVLKLSRKVWKGLKIKVKTTEKSITVYPGVPVANRINTHEDHRVAMSFAMLGSRCPGIELENPSCVAKTFPNFFDKLNEINISTTTS